MDFEELFKMGKTALEMEKEFQSMTYEEMVKAGYDALGAHIMTLTKLMDEGAPESVIAEWRRETVALRMLLKPHQEAFKRMINEENAENAEKEG